MLAVTLIFIIVFHHIFFLNCNIIIGKLSNYIYVPSSSIVNPPTLFYYSNNCQECLCYGIRSTITTFVAVNCLTNTHLCMFYSSYGTGYTIQLNSTSYFYFFQLPPDMATVTITSKSWISRNSSLIFFFLIYSVRFSS
jgi:hypothetical protein